MTQNLTPYPEYKESNIPWLGIVPSHWKVVPNRSIFYEIIDRNHPNEEMLSVTIRKGVIKQNILLSESSKKDSSNLDKSAYKMVQPGDIAYNKMRAWQGAIGVSDFKGIVSPAYIVVRPRQEINTKYFHYLMRTPAFNKEAERWSYGITSDQWSLRSEHFRMIYCSFPPLDEQAAIVRFLDHTGSRIKRYILAKQKLIKLLNKQKQAVIHQAVTRGLDPNVPLKPSGVEWLGDVPEHWKIMKLKYEMSFCGGGTPSKANEDYWKGKIPWVSPKDMKSEIIVDTEDHVTIKAVAESSTQLIPANTILMVVRSGILQRTIPIAQTSCEVSINQDMKALIPKGNIIPEFFIYFVRGCEKELIIEWTKQGATVESIEFQYLSNSKIPIPPYQEQKEIIQYLDEIVSGNTKVVLRANQQISLLQEYHTRLIADVVTGKIDVRAAASQLPVELEELEQVEDLAEEIEELEDTEESIAEEA